jgi:DNA-binding MarR family transcriptional regulator
MESSEIRSFRKILRQFERLLNSQLKHCCSGVTLAQCHALLEIEEAGEATLIQLSKNLGLDKSTLSRTIDGLVRIDLVNRVTHPSDRRFMLLTLTPRGKKTCADINRANDEYYGHVFQTIPEEKHGEVITYFRMLVQAMNSNESKACIRCCNSEDK